MQLHYPLNPATGVEDASLLPWTNGVPASDIEGSYPPFGLCTDTQSEIVNFITDNGLTLSGANLHQLGQAVQAGLVCFAIATGTATALNVTLSPVLSGLAAGVCLRVKLPVNIGSSATLNVNGLGAKAITYSDGSAVKANDYLAGSVLPLVYDGTEFQILGESIQLIKNYGRNSQTDIISATGAFSYTVPVGVSIVTLHLWGGGAGGGGATSGTPGGAPSGGGSGAYTTITLSVSPGDVITGVVGAGGSSGTSGANGGAGTSTTVTYNGITYTSGGGLGGLSATAGVAQNSVAGGTTTNGNAKSHIGAPSVAGTFSYNGSTAVALGGSGATAPGPGGGYGGNGGVGNGNPGQSPGGGGAGGGGTSGSVATGGAGANGQVWFER